ncbi:MAG: zinc finger domain-containing protein [Candidatus Pacearchaeota archaeon]
MAKCTSCGKEVTKNSMVFKCPHCSKHELVRCARCRKLSIKYKCNCGFEGP